MAEGKRRSVCSMPGGKKGYTKTLRKTWEWLSGAPRTRDDFHPWFAELGWGKSGIVKQALAFLKFMDFIVVHEDGRLDAPPPGKFDTDESIIRALDEKCEFIGDLLEEIAASPKTSPQLQEARPARAASRPKMLRIWNFDETGLSPLGCCTLAEV